jgi:hypothetical protein
MRLSRPISVTLVTKSIKPGIIFGLCDLKTNGNISNMLLPGIDVWLMKIIPSEN